jgi:glycosyltransferase involved in cell wall biosynthesis
MDFRWVLVTPGDPGRVVGGAALRWLALERALTGLAPGERVPVWCRCGQEHPAPDGADPADRLFRSKWCPAELGAVTRAVAARRATHVVFSGLELADYVRRFTPPHPVRRVLDLHNSEARLCRDLTAAINADGPRVTHARCDALEVVEAACLRSVDAVWTCTDRDNTITRSEHPAFAGPVDTVPNAVEVPPPTPQGDLRRVLFVGRIDWFPNTVAARALLREVYPDLAPRFPGVEFTVAGAAASAVAAPPDAPGNVLVVPDPADVADLWPGSVLAVPLTVGGGSRLKVLEAFAHGVPVVATRKAVEGLDVVPGVHYVPAEGSDDFRHRLRAVLDGSSPVDRMCRDAYDFVRRNHDIDALRTAVRAASN